jgi:hypothetical protein
MKLNKQGWWYFLIGGGVVLIGAYFFKRYLAGLLLIFVEYLIWGITVVYESIPEVVWLSAFLLLLLLFAVVNFPFKGQRLRKQSETRYFQPDRVNYWNRWLDISQKSEYHQWRLNHLLADLSLRILCEQERLSLTQIIEKLEREEITIPVDVRAYILSGHNPDPYRPDTKSLFTRKSVKATSIITRDVRPLIEFLETRNI